jgi:glycosyltransferase involved in cell wall biosynthesis
MTLNLLVITPWIPVYDVPFYNGLHDTLAHHGVRLVVAYGDAPPSMVRRADGGDGPWARPLKTSWVTVSGREVAHRRIGSMMKALHPDLVVVEQALHTLETYPLLVQHAVGRYGLAMWGHGRSYSTTQSALGAALKQWLTRRGDWFFAYTQSGADHVVRHGFPPARVSVLNNTIDTERLRAELGAIQPVELDGFRQQHGLTVGKTALFLGGVDERKGIGFLLEAARIAGEMMPGFVLLIAGNGDSKPAAQAAELGGTSVRLIGRLNGSAKALALSAADVLAIPQRVGLVAVDSLVSGRPIITTDQPLNGPEYDYLVAGETSVVAGPTVAEYAGALVTTLTATDRLAVMQAAARRASYRYTLAAMVDSFAEGVLAWQDLRRAGLTTGARSSGGVAELPAPDEAIHGASLINNGVRRRRRLAVVMTCHDRREQTLRCLKALWAQDVRDIELRVYLTDDGSADGTAAAISAANLPIRVISGNGDLYWAAGMALAERQAMGEDPDLLLWLNDDVLLDLDALARLLAVQKQKPDAIVVGNVRDPDTGEKTYGGRVRPGGHPQRFLLQPQTDQIQEAQAFNGNVVLIPRSVRNVVGPIDGSFAHAYADDDYGLRASKSRVKIVSTAGTVGICSPNLAGLASTSVTATWKRLQSPRGLPWGSQVRYLRRHGGPLWPAYLIWGYAKAIVRAGIR